MRKQKSRKSKPTKKVSSLSLYQAMLFGVGFYLICSLGGESISGTSAHAQNAASRPKASLPFRPIGSESMVDRYQRSGAGQQAMPASPSFRQTAYQTNRSQANGNVRQVAMQSDGFVLPQGIGGGSQPSAVPNQFAAPPLDMPPGLQSQVPPGQAAPLQLAPPPSAPALSTAPNNFSQSNIPSTNTPSLGNLAPRSLPNYQAPPLADYQPVAPPQITNGGFATMGDCRLISPPSSYTAMSPYGNSGGCGYGVTPASFNGAYTPPPAQIAAPAAIPPTGLVPLNQVPTGLASAAPVGSLVTFGQEAYPVQVGQGLWGQPVAYVPGQSVRNWLRYLSF